MMENSLTGAFGVFRFTLVQCLKSKTTHITIVVLGLLALISMPLLSMISKEERTDIESSQSSLRVLYIIDESGSSPVDYSDIIEGNEQFRDVIFNYVTEPVDVIVKLLEQEENNALLHVSIDQGYYRLKFYSSSNSSYSDSELSILGTMVQNEFRKSNIISQGITDGKLSEIDSPISSSLVINDSNVFEVDYEVSSVEDISVQSNKGVQMGRIKMNEYYLILGIFVVISVFFAFGGEGVASSIITEKSTRVIEYLLITIRPMGIIVGKVLAMLVINLMELGIIVIGVICSFGLKKVLFPNESMLPAILSDIFTSDLIASISPMKIVVALFIFIGGFIFYAFLAGFVGSCVSKIEELGEGMMLYTLTLLVGAYLSLAVIILDTSSRAGGGLSIAAYLLPVSSVFITPVYLLLGKVSIVWGIASIIILILSIGLLIYIMSMVYEALIMHRGNRIKLKDVVQLLKVKKRGIYHERT